MVRELIESSNFQKILGQAIFSIAVTFISGYITLKTVVPIVIEDVKNQSEIINKQIDIQNKRYNEFIEHKAKENEQYNQLNKEMDNVSSRTESNYEKQIQLDRRVTVNEVKVQEHDRKLEQLIRR